MHTEDTPTLRLNDGHPIPAIGFGTYKLNGGAGVQTMVSAIHQGWRLLDSAFKYENEGALGQAIRQAGVPRDQLCVVSKLPGRRHAYDEALATVQESLYRAQLDHYDLYLIHWPNPGRGLYVQAWQALIEARRRGWVRSIGVCNFLPEHLQALIDATGVPPAVNQIELHPYFPQAEQRAFDAAHGILTQSWSPLGRHNGVQQEPALHAIAQRLQRSPAQVLLRWHIQLGAIPLPKSSSPERQRENLQVFDFQLSEQDMATLNALARPDGRNADQHPAYYEEL